MISNRICIYLSVIEFSYNNKYEPSIQKATWKDLFRRRFISPIRWFHAGEVWLIGKKLVRNAMEKKKVIQEILKTTKICQISFTDFSIRAIEFEVDNWVYFKF